MLNKVYLTESGLHCETQPRLHSRFVSPPVFEPPDVSAGEARLARTSVHNCIANRDVRVHRAAVHARVCVRARAHEYSGILVKRK